MADELIVDVFVEIPKGSQNKYEFDEETKQWKLDRVLYSPVFYPTDYGHIPETLGGDGDPLDVLVLVTNPTFPGCVIQTRIVGMLIMRDEKGQDEKLLGVPVKDPRFDEIRTIEDVPAHLKKEIAHFFEVYKALEPGKESHVGDWKDAGAAAAVLEEARRNYRN